MEPIGKCTRPDDTEHRRWPDCDRCWVAGCGYSRYTEPNPHWSDQPHAICKFEHCIENQPIRLNRDDRSCPVFGHDCPGGTKQAAKCREHDRSIRAKMLAEADGADDTAKDRR